MKRMYGEFEMTTEYGPPSREVFEGQRSKRKTDRHKRKLSEGPPPSAGHDSASGETYFGNLRQPRQAFRNNQSSDTGR